MAVDYFIKLDAIDGESIDEKHKKEIKIESFSWGGSQQTTVAGTGGSGAGKVSLSDFTIMKYVDKATPALLNSMCAGTHIKDGTVTAIKAGAKGDPYLTVKFEELFVTSLTLSAGGEVPMESVSFSYNKVTMTYKIQDEKGILAAGGEWDYDLKANKLKA